MARRRRTVKVGGAIKRRGGKRGAGLLDWMVPDFISKGGAMKKRSRRGAGLFSSIGDVADRIFPF